MKLRRAFRTGLISAACGAAAFAFGVPVTQDEYRAARARIESEYKDMSAACERLPGNARDVCRTVARGKSRVARAELEYNRSGQSKDAIQLATTKADAAYDVARERCDDRDGSARSGCLAEARTLHEKALVDARLEARVQGARRDAAEDKRNADFNLAKERCEALAGDDRSACMTAARARFGKS
jgi:hypothetical protein